MLLGTVQRALLALEAARATHEEAMRISETEPSSWPFPTEMLATELCADCALAGDWAAAARLEEARALAEGIGLPGERWQILAALGELHQAQGDDERARQAFTQAGEIAQALADKIEDEGRRAEFLAAELVRRVFASVT